MIFGVSPQERIDFAKNLSVMLKSGISINEALALLAEQTRSSVFKKIVTEVQKKVELGLSFSESLADGKKIWGNIFINIVKIGEASGTMDENLSFLSEWLERDRDLRQQMKSATLYPKIIISTTFLLMGLLSIYVLPKLVPVFGQLKVELPLPTKIILALSFWMAKYWFLMLLVLGAAAAGFILLYRIRSVKRFFHGFYIRLPVVNSFIVNYQLALICRLFHTLQKSGMSINESLVIIAQAASNLKYQESFEKIKERVATGTPLFKALGDHPDLYPKSLINIIATGEKSGTLEDSLSHLAQFYGKEMERKVKKLPVVIEPVLLIFIGLVVGFVAISIIMPIYELTKGFSH